MPFYFRRSKKEGPFRITISKSGLGASVGAKGARIGTGPRGAYVYFGSHGVYYHQRIGGTPTRRRFGPAPVSTVPLQPQQPVVSLAPDQLIQSSPDTIVQQINEAVGRRLWFRVAISLAIVVPLICLGAAPIVAAVLLALGILCCWRVSVLSKAPALAYDLDAEAQQHFDGLRGAVMQLGRSDKLWRAVSAEATRDWKRHAGASNVVTRVPAHAGVLAPPGISANIAIPGIDCGNLKLYFLPDRLFLLQHGRYAAVPYDTISVSAGTTRFTEDPTAPRDAEVVAYTWRYVNKGGGPDKRFINNRQLPICLYAVSQIESPAGLKLILYVSNRTVGSQFADALNRFMQPITPATQRLPGGSPATTRSAPPPVPTDIVEARNLLGVAPSANPSEIAAAYHRLAQQYHPDKVAGLGPEFVVLAEQKMRAINAAYALLSTPPGAAKEPSKNNLLAR